MITVSAEAANVMASNGFVLRTRVESWLGSQLLDSDIPIDSGQESNDVTLAVPESLTLTVPRIYNGVSYAPGSAIDHPLASWGQRLRVYTGVDISTGTEWIRRGWFYITNTDVTGDTVNVSASGLLGQILEADLVSPINASGSFQSMVRQLVQPALSVDFTNSPADRSVPASITFEDGRLDALNELMDTWPATCYVDQDGVLQVIAVGDTSTSSLALTDGTGGTAMEWGGRTSRDGAASVVVARGYDVNGLIVQATSYDRDVNSPTMYGGNFNQLPVPYVYFSPLLTTVSQCQAAADTVLANRKKQAARTITTDAVPFLALQTRDGVTATSSTLGVDAGFGIVDQLTMPLTAPDGAMQLGVRLL